MRVWRGGFPEVQRLEARHRRRWFARYVETVIQREIELAADIRRGDAMSRMVRLLAARTGQELVVTDIARRLGIDRGSLDVKPPAPQSSSATRAPARLSSLTSGVCLAGRSP